MSGFARLSGRRARNCHIRKMTRSTDLRGAVRLAVAATAGVTDLVEAMHERIARLPGVKAPSLEGRTGGITGLVYKTVRGVTRLAGGSLDALLAMLPPALSAELPGSEREAVVAALNGVLGDYLERTANPLATAMSLRSAGRTVDTLPDDEAPGRVLVLLHGLCMNDRQWTRAGHDHGQALQRDLGYAPLYLRYNSGRHVSSNGRDLAMLLEALLGGRDRPPERVALLGHSMGGLVARSALHHGALARQRWPALITDLVCLGTPHHGAPLERAGQWIDLMLGATPYAAPFARLTQVRSAGITDLRYGNLVDEDWLGRERFARSPDRRVPVPLPPAVRCYAVAASLGQQAAHVKGRWLGDGLVPVDSALGRHAVAARALGFPKDRQWIAQATNHMQLLESRGVVAQLQRWLA